MNWSVQKGTRAAKHIPTNALDVCVEAFFRYHNVIQQYDITGSFIVNMDQLGVTLLIGNNTTYDLVGQKQIDIVVQDKKRAYTLCVASTPAGDLLPFQQVWSGSRPQSLPNEKIRLAAEKKGFIKFSLARSKKRTSHFSTLDTMKDVSLRHSCTGEELTSMPVDARDLASLG